MTASFVAFRGPLKAAVILAVGALVTSGCALLPFGSEEEASEATAAPTTVDAVAPDTAAPSETPSVVNEATWETDPQDYRDQVGQELVFDCPAGGTATKIWGVEIYTDDSSVCSAAVHVGLLTPADGGEVTIEIVGPLDSYEAGIANDIESNTWGAWSGSFSFPAAPPGSGSFEPVLKDETWALKATGLNLEVGDTYTHSCAPEGQVQSFWGSGTYTADSSICSAAAHAGVITIADGGQVTVQMTEGLEAYEASEANGLLSAQWGSYDLSFQVS